MKRGWVLLLCALGCGPVVAEEEAQGTDSPGVEASTGNTQPGTSTSSTSGTPPTPTGPTTGTTGTTSDDPSGDSSESGNSIGSSDGGGSFIVDDTGCAALPDGVLAHCGIECSIVLQDCMPGEACKAWANDGGDVWNASICTPVDLEPGAPGDPCTVEDSRVSGVDTCDVGSMCWDVDAETLEGTCVSFCEEDFVCGSPEDTCGVFNDFALQLCLPSCDPLNPTCPDGYGCYPGSEWNFVCLREGERVHIEDVFHTECPAGTFLANAEQLPGCRGESCCTGYCNLTEALPCGFDVSCEPYFFEPPPGLEDVGFCQPQGA